MPLAPASMRGLVLRLRLVRDRTHRRWGQGCSLVVVVVVAVPGFRPLDLQSRTSQAPSLYPFFLVLFLPVASVPLPIVEHDRGRVLLEGLQVVELWVG